MKRTCNGCRALDVTFCDLNYRVKRKYHRAWLYSETIPAEECPKPKTYEKLMELWQVRNGVNENPELMEVAK